MFLFRLALALGKTVNELYQTMDAVELAEWRAFAAIEPFGGPVDDVRGAIIAAAAANSHPYRKRAVRVQDCLPAWHEHKPRIMKTEDMKQVFAAWANS